MKMQFRKTPKAQRVNYSYESVTGEKFYISADDCGAEMVRQLHLQDDAEVRNNIKERKPKVEEWQKPAIRQWKEQHPGEEPPKKWVLSLDGSFNDYDESGFETSHYAGEIAEMAAEEEKDPLKELLHEYVEEMDGDSQELFRLYYMEERTQTEIAKVFGISQMAVSKRIKKLEASLTRACQEKIKKSF